MKVKKAVIPAAGFGTRFLPATKSIPKEMLNIIDKPVIHYNIEEIINAGIEDILIITGRNKESIINYFDRTPELEQSLKENEKRELLEITERVSNMANIHYIRQKEALGLGHAVHCAKTFVGNEPFALLLGDDLVYSEVPAIKQLCDAYDRCNQTIIGIQTVPEDQVNKYGIVDGVSKGEGLYKINDLVEKPDVDQAPSNLAILGRYILTPEIFSAIERIERGKGGEYQLTDALKLVNDEIGACAYEFEGLRYDAGDKLGYLKATVDYALRDEHYADDFRKYIESIVK